MLNSEQSVSVFRIIAGVAGAAAVTGGVWLAVMQRLRASFLTLAFLFGTGGAALACVISSKFVNALVHPSQIGRIRLGVGVITAFALIATFDGLRRTQLKEKYALLWIFPLLTVMFLTLFTAPIQLLREKFGMEYASIMAAVVFLSLMLAVFVLAKNLSKAERDIAALAQKSALLAEKIDAKKSDDGERG